MKEFFKRVGLFALVNAVLIGLLKLFTPLIVDHCVIIGTLFSILIGCLYEPYIAIKEGRRPDVESLCAALFGSILMGAVVVAVSLLF